MGSQQFYVYTPQREHPNGNTIFSFKTPSHDFIPMGSQQFYLYTPQREHPNGNTIFSFKTPRKTLLARPLRKTFSKKNKKNIYYDSSHNNLQLEPMLLGNGMEFIGT
jgi:hypothetical protein